MVLDISIFKIVFLILIIPISLLFEGLRRKFSARMQNRMGPPIWQPFFDIMKLFGKKESDSKAEGNVFFRIVPFLYLLTTFTLFLFIPFPLISFPFDFILFIYITILSSAFYVLTGPASNSPYGLIGCMRDVILMICYEIILVIALFSFIVYADVQSLAYLNQTFMILRLPIASLCLAVVALVEMKITPLDSPEAQTEIMGSIETEYAGRNLAFLEISKDLKFTFFIFLTAMLFFGMQNIIIFFILSFVMFFLFTLCQVTTCRYRMDQTFKILMFVLFLAVIEFIRIKFIVW